MSSTRHAKEGSPPRQERFASSAEFERGLMANLVARRCEVLDIPEDRDLIWFLQFVSHTDGGLSGLADELVKRFPDRVATRSMQRVGMKPGQIYNAEQVRAVRKEIPRRNGYTREQFPLRGEACTPGYFNESLNDPDTPWATRERILQRLEEAKLEAEKHPVSYPAADFIKVCQNQSSELVKLLENFCLDPGLSPAAVSPWYFPALVETLREHLAAWKRERAGTVVVTSLGRKVYDALDYCLESRCLVLIDGLARTGKTFSAQSWCEKNPGAARYCQVPSSSDDISFFRALARSLGVSASLNSKAHQLRERIEDTLQRSRLMLVLDEGHYIWPQGNYREALPARLNWLMTALVNYQVPVALVVTPQFMRAQKRVEEKTWWTAEQFVGRIGHYERLPDHLEKSDLAAVAKKLLPEGNADSIKLLVTYACASAKYIAGIDTVIRRARFLAKRENAAAVSLVHVQRAIQEGVIPADKALADALTAHSSKHRRGSRIAAPLPFTNTTPARPGTDDETKTAPRWQTEQTTQPV